MMKKFGKFYYDVSLFATFDGHDINFYTFTEFLLFFERKFAFIVFLCEFFVFQGVET